MTEQECMTRRRLPLLSVVLSSRLKRGRSRTTFLAWKREAFEGAIAWTS